MPGELETAYGYALSAFDNAISKACIDDKYREEMLKDAKGAFMAQGVTFPEGVNVTVHEFSPDDRHYFLPPRLVEPYPSEVTDIPRPPGVPDDLPVGKGGTHFAVARPFMLGGWYPRQKSDDAINGGW